MTRRQCLAGFALFSGADRLLGQGTLRGGGNMVVFEGELEASSVVGLVTYQPDETLAFAGAKVAMQRKGHSKVKEQKSDSEGRFRILLPPGEYWLGLTAPGFNLHFFDLTINRQARPRAIRVALTLGT